MNPADAIVLQPLSQTEHDESFLSARVRRSIILPNCTDSGNAELFAQVNKDRLRYNHLLKKWLVWNKHWWKPDSNGFVRRQATLAARYRDEMALRFGDPGKINSKWALHSESKHALDACVKLAESQEPLADSGEDWDSDPWLAGAGNGVINLKNAKLGVGRPQDRITKHVRPKFDFDSVCPRWEQFIHEIFGGDQDLMIYVQCAVGYSLTGLTTEQCLFLCWGAGSNGKSTFLSVLHHVLGDYAQNLPFSAFELQSRTSIPNDIASIAGKRFVTAVETAAETRLNESRVKALTGGDMVTARFLYGEFFPLIPAAKFWLAFNDKPVIRDTSYGMWRRLKLIPFMRQFNEESKDKYLESKLRKEAEGILAWAVRGCLIWQILGLSEPESVKCETARYRTESDTIGNFVSECCTVSSEGRALATEVYEAFKRWGGESALSQKACIAELEKRGFQKKQFKKFQNRWTWFGLDLKVTGNGR